MVKGVIYSDIGFYIGDICLALSDDTYHSVWGAADYAEGIYDTEGLQFAVGSTDHGDGTYTGEDGVEYYVDAANIGIVPIELLHTDREDTEGAKLVCVPGEADFEFDNGLFWFSLPNGEDFYVDTREEGWF